MIIAKVYNEKDTIKDVQWDKRGTPYMRTEAFLDPFDKIQK